MSEAERTNDSTGSTPPIRVVIVDDHKMFAQSLARILSDEADIAVVEVASDAAGALAAVERHQPRVVLLDHNLPGRDGLSVARDIKAANADVMIVMVTGAAEDRVLLGAIEAGCSGFLTKDRLVDEVVESVRAAAAGEVLIPPSLLARLLPQLNRTSQGIGGDLSPRELEVLELLATGATNKTIAAQLYLSVNTIRNHVQQVLVKLGAHSKLEAVATAVREGIISYPTG
jgi:DNA-binding NarL/FixJ family response regulator